MSKFVSLFVVVVLVFTMTVVVSGPQRVYAWSCSPIFGTCGGGSSGGPTGGDTFTDAQIQHLTITDNNSNVLYTGGSINYSSSSLLPAGTYTIFSDPNATSVKIDLLVDMVQYTVNATGATLLSSQASGLDEEYVYQTSLSSGSETDVTVTVKWPTNNTGNTYLFKILKKQLSGLSISQGTLSPAFSSDVFNYTATVPNATSTMTLKPTATDPTDVTITVDGKPVSSGTATNTIPLIVGSNAVPIVTTAQGTGAQKTYTVTVDRAPAIPGGLTHANVGSTGWTESWGEVTGATSYQVYVNGSKEGTTTTPSYTFTNQSSATTYSVTVAAVNNAGQMSSASSADTLTTTPNAPGALSHSSVTQTGWIESWPAVNGATGYNVYLGGNKVNSTPQSVYSYTFAGEQPDTTYSVQVSSVNGSGQESAKSSVDSVTTAVYGGSSSSSSPGIPTNLQATNVTQDGWTESWSPVPNVSSYNVYLGGQRVASTTQSVYSYTFTNEDPGTTYQVQVSSVSGKGTESALSSVDSVTTTAITSSGGSTSGGGSAHHHRSSGGSGTSNTAAGSTNTGTSGTGNPVSPVLPTVLASQTFSATGGTVNKQVGNANIQVSVPQGAFTTPEKVTVTSGSASDVIALAKGLPKGSVATVIGVNFSGATPTRPITVTITNPSIAAGGVMYKLTTKGQLVPVKATVSSGKAVVSFTSDPDFVVLDVKPNERVMTFAGHANIVPAIVGKDAGTETTYMPIWYVMHLLKQLNIQSTWDGRNWNLTTATPKTYDHVTAGTGDMHIYVDGTLVQRVNGRYGTDPSTGKTTTFMPIWYVQQVLSQLGIQNTWNGTTWSVTQQSK